MAIKSIGSLIGDTISNLFVGKKIKTVIYARPDRMNSLEAQIGKTIIFAWVDDEERMLILKMEGDGYNFVEVFFDENLEFE